MNTIQTGWDPLVKFCLPTQLQQWIQLYKAHPCEVAIVKQVPITEENLQRIQELSEIIPIRRRYRGPRHNSNNMHRDCPRDDAQRVSVYHR
jgi:hypothetical protein